MIPTFCHGIVTCGTLQVQGCDKNQLHTRWDTGAGLVGQMTCKNNRISTFCSVIHTLAVRVPTKCPTNLRNGMLSGETDLIFTKLIYFCFPCTPQAFCAITLNWISKAKFASTNSTSLTRLQQNEKLFQQNERFQQNEF